MRVMIVEDNYLVADIIRQQVVDAGHLVVGPVYRIIDALMTVKTAQIDCAVLDVHLGIEGMVTPVAEALEAVGVPFIFLTGYPLQDSTSPLGRFNNRVVLNKPYLAEALLKVIDAMGNHKGLRQVPGTFVTGAQTEEI